MHTRWLSSLALLCLTTGALTVALPLPLSAQNGTTPKPTTADLTNLPPLTPGAGDGDYAIGPQYSMGNRELPTILDNMIVDHRLPAMVAVMLNSGGGDAQGSERGLEYDTVSGKYAEFIETEVLPKITQDYHVTFSKDPNARMTMGGSSGGAAAFSMAWFHPEWYHRVLTYSGTYVNQQSPLNPASPHGAWEYHEHRIPQGKALPLRIWMQVGENDIRAKDEESTYHNWPMANRRMAAALKAKKYHYQFVFCRQAGHVDGRTVRQTLPAALEYVWKGYKPARK